MKQFLLVCMVWILGSALPVAAKAPFGSFESLEAMEQEISAKIMGLDFEGALSTMDPKGRSLSPEQKDRFVSTLKNYFRQPLTHQALVKEIVLGGGYRRAVYSYWRDGLPIYLYVVTHQREAGFWVLQYNIETSFSKIMDNF